MIPVSPGRHRHHHSDHSYERHSQHSSRTMMMCGNNDLRRLRQQQQELDELDELQVHQHQHQHQRCPVVWRWVPHLDAADVLRSSSTSLQQRQQLPRVIHVTAQEREILHSLPHVLEERELRKARDSLLQKSSFLSSSTTSSLSSPSPLLIPDVPTTLPSFVNLVDPITMKPISHPHSSVSTTSTTTAPATITITPTSMKTTATMTSNILDNASIVSSTSNLTAGDGELEIATLLLNMGGGGGSKRISTTSSSEKESAAAVFCGKKKQGIKSSSKNNNKKGNEDSTSFHSASSSTTTQNNIEGAVSTTTANIPPVVQDKYLDGWVTGSISLHTPEDDDVLSPLHCFMRKYCVEAFSATAEDVATPRYGKSHGFKVEVGQVGIRCLHCKDQSPGKRAERAVCYPSSLRNIYHSIETWQRRHSLVCKRITPWVKKSIVDLMESSKTRAGGRRKYWEDAASRLGMVDTSQGVRFSRMPGYVGPTKSLSLKSPGRNQTEEVDFEQQLVVRPEDKDLVTDYLYLLMEQMQTCQFTEEDRTGGRSKIKNNEVGFPGMECSHCEGRAGFGRYFPSSVSALSLANSDRNVYNHLQKCRRAPEQIKTELNRLQKDQTQSKNRRGLRKLFFNRIWSRMHIKNDDDKDKVKDKYNASSSSSLPSSMKEPASPTESYASSNTTRTEPVPSLPPSMMDFSPLPVFKKTHTFQHSIKVNNFRRY